MLPESQEKSQSQPERDATRQFNLTPSAGFRWSVAADWLEESHSISCVVAAAAFRQGLWVILPDGYGYGDGYGNGNGYGDGYGNGDGNGDGDGYGDGNGYGYGYGDGYGNGDGNGDGYGNGNGYGDGNGDGNG